MDLVTAGRELNLNAAQVRGVEAHLELDGAVLL
jgi:hypothetical protein